MLHVVHLVSNETPSGLTAALESLDIPVVEIMANCPVPSICLELNSTGIDGALIFIATAQTCRDLPVIASAQKAVHRPVISYALIDPDYPVSTDTWPNAPVNAYMTSPESSGSRTISLRGVEVQQFITVTELAHMIKAQVDTAQ
jgi:hypothetical protein